VVVEAEGLGPAELGEFLRREGLHEATLAQWRQVATEALAPSTARDPKTQRIAELEKQLARRDRALAETAALLLLQKKVQALWAVADDDIAETTESASLPSSKKR
jgi:transposase-like protein